jgi:sulfate permease, SulP family
MHPPRLGSSLNGLEVIWHHPQGMNAIWAAAMRGRRGARAGLARYLPAVEWLAGYQGPWLRGDLAAGVTTAAVVIPQAMAYATIAGLPVQVGLYVATVPMLVYALSGTSRPLSVSTAGVLGLGFAADFISAPVLAASRRASGC